MEKLSTKQAVALRTAMRHYSDTVMANSNADDYGIVYHGEIVVGALEALGVKADDIDRQLTRVIEAAKARRLRMIGDK